MRSVTIGRLITVIGMPVSSRTLIDESADLISEVGVGTVESSVEDRENSCGDCLNICLVESWRR